MPSLPKIRDVFVREAGLDVVGRDVVVKVLSSAVGEGGVVGEPSHLLHGTEVARGYPRGDHTFSAGVATVWRKDVGAELGLKRGRYGGSVPRKVPDFTAPSSRGVPAHLRPTKDTGEDGAGNKPKKATRREETPESIDLDYPFLGLV